MKAMFERELKDMTAGVYVESQTWQMLTSSTVAVSPALVFEGEHRYTYDEAIRAIASIDSALRSCSHYVYSRVRSVRGQFVNAFGPEMYEVVGPPPAKRP